MFGMSRSDVPISLLQRDAARQSSRKLLGAGALHSERIAVCLSRFWFFQVCCPKLLAPNSSLHFLRRAAAPDAVALVALGTISSRLTHARDARKRVWRVSITVFYFRKKIGAHRFRSGGHERITSSSAEAACGNGGATVGSRRAARGRKGIRSSHTRIDARTQAQRRGVTL